MEQSKSKSSHKTIETTGPIVKPTETFHDIHDAIDKLEDDLFGDSTSSTSVNSIQSPTLGELLHMKITYGKHIKIICNFFLSNFYCHFLFLSRKDTTSLDRFHMQITAHEMYPENSTVVKQLLEDMATLPIRKVGEFNKFVKFDHRNSLGQPKKNVTFLYYHIDEMDLGTQFKLTITYNNGMNALFKPKR